MKQQYTYRLPFFFIKILTLIEKRSYKVICIKMKTSFIQLILLVFLSAVFTDSGIGKAVLDRTVTIPGNLPVCPVQFIRQAITAHDGTIWVAGEQAGIHRLPLKETYNEFWEDMRYFSGAPDTLAFTSIAEDRQHRIWAGTDNRGVAVFDGGKWQVYDRTNVLAGDHVYSLAVAPRSGLVAIATSGGVSLYDPEKDQWRDLTRAEGLLEDQVESVAFDGKEQLWLAYSCGGVASSSPQKNYRDWNVKQAKWYWDSGQTLRQPVRHRGEELPSNLCNSILPVQDGKVLVGTCAGLACLEGKNTWRYVRGKDYSAKNRNIYSPGKKKKTPSQKVDADALLPEDYVTCMAETERGYWVGTRTGGAVLLGKKALNVIAKIQGDKKNPLPCKWIRSIIVLPNGAVLGATYGKGLSVLFPRPEAASVAGTEIRPDSLPLPSMRCIPREENLVRNLQEFEENQGKATRSPVFFADEDWSTLGDWCFRYGNRLAVLCAANAPVSDGYAVDPSYFRLRKAPPNNEGIEYIQDSLYDISRTIGPLRTPDDAIRSWVMAINEPYNRNILYHYKYAVRTKSDWDDHGEAYSPSVDGPDIWLVLVVPQGISTASLYFYNKEGFALPGDSRRDYLIEVKKYKPGTDLKLLPMTYKLAQDMYKAKRVEGENCYEKDLDNMIKAPVLARCRVRDFISTPVYKTFVLEGPATYCVRICRNNSFNTIISGVFLGQNRSFMEREGDEHLDPSYYKMPIHLPAVQEEKLTAAEKAFLQAMRMPENDFIHNGAVFSRRRSLLLQGNRFLAQSKEETKPLRTHARWALNLWDQEDREQFDNHMLKLWETAQENCVGLRSRAFTPYSPDTIPFSTQEIMAMDKLGINWKEYRDNASPRPQIPVSEMKKILQKHLETSSNNN